MPDDQTVERLHNIRDFLNTVTGWTGSTPDELQEAVEDVDHLLAALGPQLTAEEAQELLDVIADAQPKPRKYQSERDAIAKLSLIAKGGEPPMTWRGDEPPAYEGGE